MRACARCGGQVDERFRYCPWCSAPQRLKLVEFFTAHPALARDHGRALRVSRYLGPRRADRHVRFSVWTESDDSASATAAVSLDDREAARLARFLVDSAPSRRGRGLRARLREVRDAWPLQ